MATQGNSALIFINNYIGIMNGYFILPAGTYTSSDILLTLPIKPKYKNWIFTSISNIGSTVASNYVIGLNTDGTLIFNNSSVVLSTNTNIFVNHTFLLA